MTFLLLYLFIALFFSFTCSILEAVLLSVTPSYIGMQINEGKKSGKLLKKYKENIDLPLAAILTLNTFAHTIGAAGVGAQAQEIWGNQYLSLVSAILTIIILIFSEIIPKTIGASYWKSLAPISARILTILIYSPLYPIIIFSKQITKWLNRNKEKSALSRAEFQAITEIGIQEGIFRQEESEILKNLLKFNKISVRNIMTPRTVMLCAPEDKLIEEFYGEHQEMRISRIPVFREHIDELTGFVLKDDIMKEIIEEKGNQPLKTIRRPIPVVNEQMPIIRLFYKFIELHTEIAAVVGEYGETTGLVTMEDVVETLLGLEFMDETDNIEDMQVQARKNWEARAKRLGIIE